MDYGTDLGLYRKVGIEIYRIFINDGVPCVDVSSFYGKTPFRDRTTGKSIPPDQALERLRDQAKTLIRKARETAAQEDSGLVAHATTV